MHCSRASHAHPSCDVSALAGRVALVTGAGRRVGRAIAVALGAEGMRVVAHYNVSADGALETARLVTAAGGSATVVQADLGNVSACEQLIDTVVSGQGELHSLVNSAAIMLRTPVGTVSEGDWDAMYALNVRAPFFLTQRAAPALRATGGSVVNIADLAAFETWTGYVPHGMTKAAVVQMTRALAHALAPEVRVNAVAPGVVLLPEGFTEAQAEHLRRTTPLQRIGTPEDVAAAVVYLLCAGFVTGEIIRVDGGRHVRR
ncbi:MAG: SDR family oxidoreductase [Polaromonas sp.]|nr:SDR family oxidoreductase [Gemmatimonadaceae bacterium]